MKPVKQTSYFGLKKRTLDADVRNMDRTSMASLTSVPNSATADKELGAKAGARKSARSSVGPRQSAATALSEAGAHPARGASEARTSNVKPVRSFVGSRRSMAALRPDPEVAVIDKSTNSKLGTRRPAKSSVGPRQSAAALTSSVDRTSDRGDGEKPAAAESTLSAIGSRPSYATALAGVRASIADENPRLADSV